MVRSIDKECKFPVYAYAKTENTGSAPSLFYNSLYRLFNVGSVRDTSGNISGRVTSLAEAKNGLMEIISDLSAISEENAASTEETNASMQELNATFAMISDSASKLQTIATDLTDTISYFNT